LNRSSWGRFPARTALVGAGTALLLVLPTLPAFAEGEPAAPTTVTASIGDRFVGLTWSGGTGDGAIVRDISGVAGTITPTSGRGVATDSPTTAHDAAFTNTAPSTYAVWTTNTGVISASYVAKDVAVAPLVPTTLTFAVSHSSATYGTVITVTGALTRPGGLAVPNQAIGLYGRDGGTSSPVLIRTLRTASDGTVRTTLRPQHTLTMGLRFAGDAFSGASSSSLVASRVVPLVSASLSPAAVRRTQTTTLTGHLLPAYAGARVIIQQKVGSAWRSLGATRTSSTAVFRYVLAAPTVGTFTYRAALPATAGWSASASRPLALRVDARDLVRGLTGDDVLALQKRLAALHYGVGAQNGTFGPDLYHAVVTFQKVERLPRTGVFSSLERNRLVHPTAWKLYFAHPSGYAAEVDVTRQVLVLSKDGVIVRIADVSTGGEYTYSYKGVSSVAHTPRGQYRVISKIDGIRISNLGYLYRPSYFASGGFAVHGEGYDVPSRPASHGCVRVTNLNADFLFPLLAKGTPVTVFDE
jgi:N-acetylmuramoyl-L-alanine amidase